MITADGPPVPTFHHSDDGTAESVWTESIRGARTVHFVDLPVRERVVVVAPHPDDESLGAGGLVAGLSSAGIAVRVVICSDGGAAFGQTAPANADLVTLRSAEVRAAVERLSGRAPIELHELGLPDGELAANAGRLAEYFESLFVDADLLVSPWPGDGHPDHEAVGLAVRASSGGRPVLEYPIWAWHWATPDVLEAAGSLVKVPLSAAAQRAKQSAIDEHRSQLDAQADGGEAVVSAEFRTHFERSAEVFVVDPGTLLQLGRVGRSTATFFDSMYRSAPSGDPWDLLDDVNGERYDRLIGLLGTIGSGATGDRPLFARTLELGCGTGQLTTRLAAISREVVAIDGAETATEAARGRCAGIAGVEIRAAMVPDGLRPSDRDVDLIVISDMAYYFDETALRNLIVDLDLRCSDAAVLLASHWRGESEDHELDASSVHSVLRSVLGDVLGWTHELAAHEESHLVELWKRP